MIFVCLKKTNRRFHPPNICIRGLKMGVSGDILGVEICFAFFPSFPGAIVIQMHFEAGEVEANGEFWGQYCLFCWNYF